MFHQKINLPLIVESIDLNNLNLNKILERYNLEFQKVLILTGENHSLEFANKIISSNPSLSIDLHTKTKSTIDAINKLILDGKYQLILGVGGGQVLDTAKYLASEQSLPYIAIPTVISSDALASPISILKNSKNTKGYSSNIPSGIFIDYAVIANAGQHHFISGLGDILSNLSALNDWDLAIKKGTERPNNFARFLSEVSVNNILNQTIDFGDPDFIKVYVNSIIMSGLAMNIAGNSRPCSGSEHLIAHAISQLRVSPISHGLLVGSITPYTLFLQNCLSQKVIDILRRYDLVTSFATLLDSAASFEDILNLAKHVRGNRYTILNTFSDSELKDKYIQFIDTYI